MADCENEPFSQVKLINVKDEFIEIALEHAIDIVWRGCAHTISDVKRIATNLIKTNAVVVQENAIVAGDAARVCISGDIEDNDTKFRALDMIYATIDAGGQWSSGKNLRFDISELPEF